MEDSLQMSPRFFFIVLEHFQFLHLPESNCNYLMYMHTYWCQNKTSLKIQFLDENTIAHNRNK